MSDLISGWCQWRIKKNKNAIIVINGSTGSGKTYSAIREAVDIAEKMGTSFTVEGNIFFNFVDGLRQMQLEENQKAGTVFLFEEVGAVGGGGSFREWQSKANTFFNSFLQTSRHKQQVLIMTTPSFSYLDAGSRKLVHMQCEMQGINYRKKVGYIKPFTLQVSQRTGKIYFKLLRTTKNGKKFKVSSVQERYPPSNIVKAYEKVKTEYTTALNQMIIDKSEEKQNKENRNKPLTDLQQEIKNLVDSGKSVKEISELKSFSLKNCYNHIKSIQNKGFPLEI